ncbi:uncharacterized protein G2W53_021158 [Senna tora]|uniref:Uncharacterized protein n=1 Tax=Senna tora TaxID=362788 RepID=A0A834TKX1_9FABA|nr:uncharacterized protein G2W53_021158 [Senna tora]
MIDSLPLCVLWVKLRLLKENGSANGGCKNSTFYFRVANAMLGHDLKRGRSTCSARKQEVCYQSS